MSGLVCFCVSNLLLSCERPAPGGVVGVFGQVGLAPGSFHYPRAIATEPNGSIFVVDKSGRIQRFAADGTFETSWRLPKTNEGFPVGLSVHPDGRILVADTHNHRVLLFDRDGKELGSFGKEGTGDGEFLLPTDVAVDADGNFYVAEYQGNDRITKWSADLSFVGVVTDQPIEGLRLSRPAGIDIDQEQTLWIADACNHRIIRMTLDGRVITVFGGRERLRYPYDICVTPDNTIMVCEYEGNRLHWFTKDGQSLHLWGKPGRRPGELFAPWGATYGPSDNVYVVDSRNNRVQIVRP